MKKWIKLLKLAGYGFALLPGTKPELSVTLPKLVDKLDEITSSEDSNSVKTAKAIKAVTDELAPGIKKLSFQEGREYTKRQTLKHIIATEEHFREGLCSACLLEKHLPALEMYADEGLSYCEGRECEAYRELKSVVKEAESRLMRGDISESTQTELASKFRNVRKKLVGYGEMEEKLDELVESDRTGAEAADTVRAQQAG